VRAQARHEVRQAVAALGDRALDRGDATVQALGDHFRLVRERRREPRGPPHVTREAPTIRARHVAPGVRVAEADDRLQRRRRIGFRSRSPVSEQLPCWGVLVVRHRPTLAQPGRRERARRLGRPGSVGSRLRSLELLSLSITVRWTSRTTSTHNSESATRPRAVSYSPQSATPVCAVSCAGPEPPIRFGRRECRLVRAPLRRAVRSTSDGARAPVAWAAGDCLSAFHPFLGSIRLLPQSGRAASFSARRSRTPASRNHSMYSSWRSRSRTLQLSV